jgi:hypothetical protein
LGRLIGSFCLLFWSAAVKPSEEIPETHHPVESEGLIEWMALKIPVDQKPVYQQNEQRHEDCVRQSLFPSLKYGHGCLDGARFAKSSSLAMLAAIRRAFGLAQSAADFLFNGPRRL